VSTPTETRLPPVGVDVMLWAACRGCGRKLGYWHFVWDGEPRTFTGHICSGKTQDVAVVMEWLEIGEPLDGSDEGASVSACP
jgi:hypothetical protein